MGYVLKAHEVEVALLKKFTWKTFNMLGILKDAIRFNMYYWTKTPDGGEEPAVKVDVTNASI